MKYLVYILFAAAMTQAQTDLPGPINALPDPAHASANPFTSWEKTQTFREGFVANNAITANLIWIMPAVDGTAGAALVTDGTGNLSFGSGACLTCMVTTGLQTVTGTDTWNASQIFGNNNILYWKDTGGTSQVGLYLDNIDNYNLGMQAAAHTSNHGWIDFWANGTEWLQLTATGQFQPVTDGSPFLGANGLAFGQVFTYGITMPSLGALVATLGIESQNANGHYVDIRAAASVAATYILALPPNGGTNGYFLQTDGTGITSWAAGACPACLLTTGLQAITGTDTWNASQIFGNNDILYWKDTGGTSQVGLYLDNIDNYNLGMQSAAHTSGHGFINFWANGQEWFTLTASGVLEPITDGTGFIGNGGLSFASMSAYSFVAPSINGGVVGQLGLESQNGNGHYVNILAAASVTATYNMYLPASMGSSGQFLQTDGVHTTTWATAAGVTSISPGTLTGAVILAGNTGQINLNQASQTITFSFPSIIAGQEFNAIGVGVAAPLTTGNIALAGNLNIGTSESGTFNMTGNQTITGNFYNRTFSGAPSCSGVADGWQGFDTSGLNLDLCSGSALLSVPLGAWNTSFTPSTTNLSSVVTDVGYALEGKTCHLRMNISGSTVTSGAVSFTLPFAPKSSGEIFVFALNVSGTWSSTSFFTASGTTITSTTSIFGPSAYAWSIIVAYETT